MVELSYVMLISRCNEQLFNSLRSVQRQNPDSFKAYLDEYRLGENTDIVCDIVKLYGGEPIIQQKAYNDDGSPLYMDHHVDVVHAHHKAFLEADNPVICQIDDDDEMLSNRRDIVDEYFDDDVGIIYGDVFMLQKGHKPRMRKSRQITRETDVNQIKGSGRILNRDAFKEIHNYVDHGYWLDFKIYYWIMRAGYRAVYVPRLFSIQNYNLVVNREREEARISGWQQELKKLEKQEFL